MTAISTSLPVRRTQASRAKLVERAEKDLALGVSCSVGSATVEPFATTVVPIGRLARSATGFGRVNEELERQSSMRIAGRSGVGSSLGAGKLGGVDARTAGPRIHYSGHADARKETVSGDQREDKSNSRYGRLLAAAPCTDPYVEGFYHTALR